MEIFCLEKGIVGNYQPTRSESISGQVIKIPLFSIAISTPVNPLELLFTVSWVVDVYSDDSEHLFSGYATKKYSLKVARDEQISSSKLFSLIMQVGDFLNEEGKRSDLFIPIRNLNYLINPDDFAKAKIALQEEVRQWNETNFSVTL